MILYDYSIPLRCVVNGFATWLMLIVDSIASICRCPQKIFIETKIHCFRIWSKSTVSEYDSTQCWDVPICYSFSAISIDGEWNCGIKIPISQGSSGDVSVDSMAGILPIVVACPARIEKHRCAFHGSSATLQIEVSSGSLKGCGRSSTGTILGVD